MAIPVTYYVLLQDGKEKPVINSQPPVLTSLDIEDEYYRDLGGGRGAVAQVLTNSPQTVVVEDLDVINQEVIVATPVTGGAVVSTTGASALTTRPDDELHVKPRQLDYKKSGWKFMDAANNLLAWPMFDDVVMFSTAPVLGTAPQPITQVTPDDTATFAASTSIYCSGGGTIAVLLADGVTALTFTATAHTIYTLACVQVKATGTTATGILRW